MPNFPNLRVRYLPIVDNDTILKEISLIFELYSFNFDINQTTIGPSTPFTTELSFEMKLGAVEIPTKGSLKGDGAFLPGYNLEDFSSFTNFIQKVIFSSGNIAFNYINLADSQTVFTARLAYVSVTPQTPSEHNINAGTWLVQFKFLGTTPSDITSAYVSSPQLVLTSPLLGELSDPSKSILDPGQGLFNSELIHNQELMLLPPSAAPSPGTVDSGLTNTIGKVADEIADSFANLGDTIAGKLSSTINTRLQPVAGQISYDLAFWAIIKKATEDLSFSNFERYMDTIFCYTSQVGTLGTGGKDKLEYLSRLRSTPFMGVDAYQTVKVATEAFVMVNCMTDTLLDEETVEDLGKNVPLISGVPDAKQLDEWWKKYKERVNGAGEAIPYLAVIQRKLRDSTFKTHPLSEAFLQIIDPSSNFQDDVNCYGILSQKLTHPCFLELIWSYWHEESMMVQGLNAVSRRFQNIKAPGPVDPLANLEIDPLRPLSNLMWGYIQDEQHRLTVRRRAYEYNHHYGINLQGTAVQNMQFADSRSKFIEAFHTLLHLTSKYFKQADDMTVQADSFPVLNALKEVHLVLSEGAHNQYGELPSVARAEMLTQQWLFARPEFREFLPTRVMVAFPEPWMDRVSALNNLMGWTKTSVMHFRDLGVFGEQLLLSIRFGNWANVNNRFSASNWANFWRSQIQSYIHAYRTVTGIDLTADVVGNKVDATQPSVHLYRKWAEQRGGKAA